tara:strand:- start:144 stop:1253 length:1110 start_codon:yes stop_codon:yes gene_type:complete
MIQGFTESNITAFLSTEDNRIDTAANISKIRILVKLINDMNGDVEYCYPSMGKGILPRYTQMIFSYNVAPDRYAGTINLLPAGHWKYEVYEVVWIETPVVAFGTAPATETDVLPVSNINGIVKGIVTKGILNLTAKAGTGQVQYTEHQSPDSPNYVWYGTDIDVWNPADESSAIAWYKNKVGITLDGSGNVSEWKDSSANTFNMLQSTAGARPSYTASTGGVIFNPNVVSDILASTSDMALTGQFSVGFKTKAVVGAATPGILTSKSKISYIKLNGATGVALLPITGAGIALVTTQGNNEDAYIVITRNAANLVELNFNGVVEQSATMTGTLNLNEMGKTLDGSIFEILVFDSTSQALTDNINERLSNL